MFRDPGSPAEIIEAERGSMGLAVSGLIGALLSPLASFMLEGAGLQKSGQGARGTQIRPREAA